MAQAKHILVTGGAGFIGSHLCASLTRDGHRLTVIDDLSTGKREHVPADARLIEDDISRDGVFDAPVKDADACFHLAAIASVERSANEWRRTHQVNLGGTVNLFDAIARSGKKIPVVYASSAATYGVSEGEFLSESSPSHPASAYGADKLACEFHGRVAAQIHSIPNIGLRFFNVYGPRQDPKSPYSGVISIFAGKLAKKEPLTIHGDGKQSRDFIYVDDIVRGLRLSLEALQAGKIDCGVMNLCTGQSTDIDTLAETLARLSGVKAELRHGPARPGDMRRAIGDAARAKSGIGFSAQVALVDGLRQTLEWIRSAA